MEPGTETSRSSCVLETRGQPGESTGNPLDWKLGSKLPDVLLGFKESKMVLVKGSTPSKKKKKPAHRGGAGNIEAPAPTTTEGINKTIGCCTGQAHVRR
jgi:hypothetical protein